VRLDEGECRRRLAEARVGRLATADATGQPHLVPITFAMDRDELVFVIDLKPKTTTALRRLRNIDENPAVSVLVDHYEDDWTQLWWVRADGRASIADPTTADLELLSAKYPQYRQAPPPGPAVRIAVTRLTGWRP
jgi:PPOX class probable F420-dependent enzyme